MTGKYIQCEEQRRRIEKLAQVILETRKFASSAARSEVTVRISIQEFKDALKGWDVAQQDVLDVLAAYQDAIEPLDKYEINCLVDNVDDRTIPHHVIVPVKSWERIREMIGYPLPDATKGIMKDGK